MQGAAPPVMRVAGGGTRARERALRFPHMVPALAAENDCRFGSTCSEAKWPGGEPAAETRGDETAPSAAESRSDETSIDVGTPLRLSVKAPFPGPAESGPAAMLAPVAYVGSRVPSSGAAATPITPSQSQSPY